jgi:hypothetical protein
MILRVILIFFQIIISDKLSVYQHFDHVVRNIKGYPDPPPFRGDGAIREPLPERSEKLFFPDSSHRFTLQENF